MVVMDLGYLSVVLNTEDAIRLAEILARAEAYISLLRYIYIYLFVCLFVCVCVCECIMCVCVCVFVCMCVATFFDSLI